MRGQGWLFLVWPCSLGLPPLPELNLLRSIIRSGAGGTAMARPARLLSPPRGPRP